MFSFVDRIVTLYFGRAVERIPEIAGLFSKKLGKIIPQECMVSHPAAKTAAECGKAKQPPIQLHPNIMVAFAFFLSKCWLYATIKGITRQYQLACMFA